MSSARCSVYGAFDPWQASPLGRPRIGWGAAEGLIIEHGAAEAVGVATWLVESRRSRVAGRGSLSASTSRSSLVPRDRHRRLGE